ncbi:hypothetical protein PE067_20820 [Paracoccus sp. DMF-8]|uniref:hypothetical protein n=1 Tax=Paracoccus sp. DMF-8 TaxID=3019445 RepID=UPI0023E3D65B|nr:hypothetical protein [Paracoccus sp. DMF-8]MDF3608372.1 hypothetical protein [Paracoccus sp. DMF-8]
MSFERIVNNFPAGWRKTVDTWSELNNRYYEHNDDLPAWYVENSNSALLSAAAWMNGYPAICEMDVEKKSYTGTRGRPRSYAGRMDIEIQFDNKVYWIEAKRRAFTLSQNSNYSFRHSFLASSVKDAMSNARQCRDVAHGFGVSMASVVFFSGHIESDAPERRGRDAPGRRAKLIHDETAALKENMKALSDEICEDVYHAIYARNDVDIPRGWTDYHWPAAFGICAILDS